MHEEEWTIIHRYTRAQAIADEVLVDVTEMARTCGFKVPVALTSTVWEDCVAWTQADSDRQTHQDELGRLWDVLFVAYVRCLTNLDGSRVGYWIARIPRDGHSTATAAVTLSIHIGPGDHSEPVITIMFPHED